jgi:hypothetical protein
MRLGTLARGGGGGRDEVGFLRGLALVGRRSVLSSFVRIRIFQGSTVVGGRIVGAGASVRTSLGASGGGQGIGVGADVTESVGGLGAEGDCSANNSSSIERGTMRILGDEVADCAKRAEEGDDGGTCSGWSLR